MLIVAIGIKQSIGVGDGIKKEFQLYKSYQDDEYPYIRKITRISKNSLKIFLEEKEIKDWEITQDKGIVILQNPPNQDTNLLASFDFYIYSV